MRGVVWGEGGRGDIRRGLEAGRGGRAETRLGRFGESGRGARLLVLQVADLLFAGIIALEEVLDGADPALAAAIEATLADVAVTLGQIADGVEDERRLPTPAPPAWRLDDAGPHAAGLLERLRGYAHVA